MLALGILQISPGSPLPALITTSFTTALTSQSGFCIMRGKFCHSYFEITPRTGLAQFGHFTLRTLQIRFQMEGASTPQTPSLGAPQHASVVIFAICQQNQEQNF